MIEFSNISRSQRAEMAAILTDINSEDLVIEQKIKQKQSSAKRAAYVLNLNIEGFIKHFGLDNCGFLTLTFPDDVKDVRQASKRFNSMRTNFLDKHILGYIGVYERTKRGVIHFHFIIACKGNIREGFDFKAIANNIYSSNTRNDFIASLWQLFRTKLPKYGFGRHQLVPIKCKDGIARYLSKYIIKGLGYRKPEDKHFRFVRSSQDKGQWWKRASQQFAWYTPSSIEWRKALQHWVKERADFLRMGFYLDTGFFMNVDEDTYSLILKKMYGHKWCYDYQQQIIFNYQRHKERALQ